MDVAEHSVAPSNNMSEGAERQKRLVEHAAAIVAASEGKVKIVDSMKLVGFRTPERKNMRVYQQVRCRTSKLVVVEKGKKDRPVTVNMSSGSSAVSALSVSDERTNTNSREPSSSSSGSSRALTTPAARLATSRTAAASTDTASTDQSSTTPPLLVVARTKSAEKTPAKRSRRTSKECQRHNAGKALQYRQDKEAMKLATRRIYQNSLLPRNHPAKATNAAIVDQINISMNSGISYKTAADYVRKGMVGTSPLKRGPVGPFPPHIYKALQGAFVTYLKLEQAECKRQSTIKQMSRLVNACVNKAGHNKS